MTCPPSTPAGYYLGYEVYDDSNPNKAANQDPQIIWYVVVVMLEKEVAELVGVGVVVDIADAHDSLGENNTSTGMRTPSTPS